MKRIDLLERRTVFVFTRVFALFAILAFAASAAAAAVTYLVLGREEQVTLREIRSAIGETESADSNNNVADTTLPENVKKHMSSENNRHILAAWIDDLSPSQRRDFVDNLDRVIVQAETEQLDVAKAINGYKTLKLSKLRGDGFGQYANTIQKGALVLFITVMLGLIAVFSMFLVLLAIERNTRVVPMLAEDDFIPMAADVVREV